MEPNYSQNSAQWYVARLFHFTSSEVQKLLSDPKSKETKDRGDLSDGAKSYVYDKIAEYITNGACLDYKDLNTRAITWGKDHEDSAAMMYQERTGKEVEECGFFEYNSYFGGSPDRLVGADGILEIKCPYNTSNHVEYLQLKTSEDLKKAEPVYYSQIQGNLIATKREWCDFVSYDPRCQNDAFALKILRIPRDEAHISKILQKLERANIFKEQVIKEIIQLQYA